ncbi:hypothetical protein WJX74_008196 [Apatococcus lobatus]|uniref:Uncharacterized protein n=1 Tax=Apatococcus lobatus TaxID=904363 RepID=A0AAW1R038_9CHLO
MADTAPYTSKNEESVEARSGIEAQPRRPSASRQRLNPLVLPYDLLSLLKATSTPISQRSKPYRTHFPTCRRGFRSRVEPPPRCEVSAGALNSHTLLDSHLPGVPMHTTRQLLAEGIQQDEDMGLGVRYLATIDFFRHPNYEQVNIRLANNGFDYIHRNGQQVPRHHSKTWVLLPGTALSAFPRLSEKVASSHGRAHIWYDPPQERMDLIFEGRAGGPRLCIAFEKGYPDRD